MVLIDNRFFLTLGLTLDIQETNIVILKTPQKEQWLCEF